MADLSVRVSDFGLSKVLHDDSDYYKLKHDTMLPVRWMAPESLIDMRFSSKCLFASFVCLLLLV